MICFILPKITGRVYNHNTFAFKHFCGSTAQKDSVAYNVKSKIYE